MDVGVGVGVGLQLLEVPFSLVDVVGVPRSGHEHQDDDKEHQDEWDGVVEDPSDHVGAPGWCFCSGVRMTQVNIRVNTNQKKSTPRKTKGCFSSFRGGVLLGCDDHDVWISEDLLLIPRERVVVVLDAAGHAPVVFVVVLHRVVVLVRVATHVSEREESARMHEPSVARAGIAAEVLLQLGVGSRLFDAHKESVPAPQVHARHVVGDLAVGTVGESLGMHAVQADVRLAVRTHHVEMRQRKLRQSGGRSCPQGRCGHVIVLIGPSSGAVSGFF